MSVLEKFLILFESDASDTSKDVKKLDKSLDDTEKSAIGSTKAADGASKQFTSMGVKALGAVGGIMAVAGAFTALVGTAQKIDELGKFADLIGESIEDVDAWGGAVVRAGGTVEGFRGTVESLNEKMVDASVKGQNEITPFFNQLGISIKDSNGKLKSTLNILPELAESFGRISKQESLGIGKKLGLDQGTIALLQQGPDAIDELIKRQKMLGLASAEAAKASAEFNDIMADLKQVSGFAAQSFLVSFIPAVTWTIDKLLDLSMWARENKPIIYGFFIGLAVVAIPALVSLAAAGWAAIAPFLIAAAPFIAIGVAAGAAGAAIALVIEDIMAFVNGQDSLLGDIAKKWPVVGAVVLAVVEDIKGFVEIMKAFGGFLLNIFIAPEKALESITDAVGLLKKSLDTLSGEAFEKLSETFNGIKSFFGFGDDSVDLKKNIAIGQDSLSLASGSPIASQTSSSILNSSKSSNKSTSVQTGDIIVQTQATDSQGIASTIGGSLEDQMRTTVDSYDDGVLV